MEHSLTNTNHLIAIKQLTTAFDKWHEKPEVDATLTSLRILIHDMLMEVHDSASQPGDSNLKTCAINTLVDTFRIIVENRIVIYEPNETRLIQLLLEYGGWKRMVDVGEEYLLAACLMLSAWQPEESSQFKAASKITAQWTGLVFEEQTGDRLDKIASMLFGGYWVALYKDEVCRGFRDVHAVLLKSSPVFVFKEKHGQADELSRVTLPYDLEQGV